MIFKKENFNTLFKKKIIIAGTIIAAIIIIGTSIYVKTYQNNNRVVAAENTDTDNDNYDSEEVPITEENLIEEEPRPNEPEATQEAIIPAPEPQANNVIQAENTQKSDTTLSQPEPAKSAPSVPASQNQSFVANLKVARQTSQLIIVSGNGGSSATVSMHSKINGLWKQQFSVDGHVGYNGMTSNKHEGDGKTPIGVYGFGQAFGVNGNPGTSLSYRQVNGNDYWVDDVNSPHYNQFVNTASVGRDWNSAEHIVDHAEAYAYAINIEYNSACTRGKGSAIFLHCSTGGGTAGCVSVPRNTMINILNNIQSNCLILIAPSSSISNY